MSPVAARERQRELKAAGFDCGPVDGEWGRWSEAAERQYQLNLPRRHGGVAGTARAQVLDYARSKIGRLPRATVLDIVADAGGKTKDYPFNAAFLHYCGQMALAELNPLPRSLWSRDYLVHPTWRAGWDTERPQEGDVFGIYFQSVGYIAHAGFIAEWAPREPYCLTIETTQNELTALIDHPESGRPAVQCRRRLKSDVYAARNWFA